jgi:hypothetical protein
MQRLTPAQVYNQRQNLVDQEVTNRFQANVAGSVAADDPAPGTVNDKVGEIGK